MREILFKARRLDNGEWVVGDLLHDVLVEMAGEKSEAVIVTPFNGTFPVDPETVCQYTGMTDKNGVEVWEGDILKYKANYAQEIEFVVKFDPYAFMAFRPIVWGSESYDNGFSKYAEVIGNIHDGSTIIGKTD